MRNVALLAGLLVVASVTATEFSPSDSFPKSAYLNERSIQEAVEWGNAGKARPYHLYSKGFKAEPSMAVYTPFVRVGMAAQEARRRGGSIEVTRLPAWVTEATVHVVVRPPHRVDETTLKAFPGASSLKDVPIAQIGLSSPQGAIFHNYIAPISVVRDLSYLDIFGGKPFDDAAAAAVFEPMQMTRGVDVYGWWRNENHYYPSHGVLETNEMSTWR